MKESLKKNWKGITATVVAFGAVFGAIYYVNCIYLPGRQQAEATKLTATQPVTPKEYNYTVSTANSQTADTSSTDSSDSSTNPANDRIKVTTDKDGTVTIDRTWDAKPGELDTTTTAPSASTANIGSGGGKITGDDGAYYGEQAATTTPSTDDKTTTPATGSSDSTTTTKPSNSTTTPTTPSKPSTPSTPSSSTPQVGDTRIENGQKQVYVDGFGWIADTSGGSSDYIEMGPDTGECCENATFG